MWLDMTNPGVGPNAGVDGTVFVPSDNALVALDGHDGDLKWNSTLESFACGVPAVGRDGSLYVMTWKSDDFLTGSAQALFADGSLK